MTKHSKSSQLGLGGKGGGSTNEDHLMAICILPYHRMPSDMKLCLAFLIVPTNNLGLMFGHGNAR
jgi:hypothetical protein